jgi:hypothetical protein
LAATKNQLKESEKTQMNETEVSQLKAISLITDKIENEKQNCANLTNIHQSEVYMKMKSVTDQNNQFLAALKSEFEKTRLDLDGALDAADEKIENTTAEFKSSKKRIQNEVNEKLRLEIIKLTDAYNTEVNDLTTKHTNTITQLKSELENLTQSLKQDLENELIKTRSAYDDILNSLKTEHQKQLEGIQTDCQKHMSDIETYEAKRYQTGYDEMIEKRMTEGYGIWVPWDGSYSSVPDHAVIGKMKHK